MGLSLIAHMVSHWHVTFAVFGTLLTLAAVVFCVRRNFSLGPPIVVVPLAILVLSMVLSNGDMMSKVYAIGLLGTYLLCRNLNSTRIYYVLTATVLVSALSLMFAHDKTGGILYNRNIAVGVLVICTLLSKTEYQWLLIGFATVGLALTGAEQAVVGLTAAVVVLIVKRDWSKKILFPATVIVLALIATTPLGNLGPLWQPFTERFGAISDALTTNSPEERLRLLDSALTERVDDPQIALDNIRPLGHGYRPFGVLPTEIHNALLRALYEVGPVAALAWLFLVLYCLVRTKMKYVFAAVLALSLFDHFLWSTLSPLVWTAIGMASATQHNDNIYKEV